MYPLSVRILEPSLKQIILYVKPFVAVAEPSKVVTTTFTAPARPGGVMQVISVSETTITDVAGVPPKVTEVVPVKPVPVIVTEVPPSLFPEFGEIFVIVGGGGTTNARVGAP